MGGPVEFLDIVALAVFACCLALLGIVWRRSWLRRHGATVDLCVRDLARGHGFVLGVGRFAGDRLEWFRLFSALLRPRRTFERPGLEVVGRRKPTSAELISVMAGAVVVSCETPSGPVELAMEESAVTGFLAWLEAAPPGAAVPSVSEQQRRL